MLPKKTKAQELFERVVTIVPLPRPEVEPEEPKKAAENVLCGDEYVTEALLPGELKTPLGMYDRWAQDQQAFGRNIPKITMKRGYKKWGDTAHLEVEGPALLDEGGLHLHFSVACNPDYMCRPRDLVPVYLETAINHFATMVVLLEPTYDNNFFDIEVTYTLQQVCTLLKIEIAHGKDLKEQIGAKYRELGLRAQWLGVQGQELPQPNGVKHESGGLDQKNGSGKLRLFPYTIEELQRSEAKNRNISWNMAEQMGTGRPVFQAFSDIIQPGKEMMTTLEAESEYLAEDEEQLDSIISALTKLSKDTEAQKKYGIVKMTAEPKRYVDSYFDLADGLPLLSNKIVVRRRHSAKDVGGTYLFACKGATYAKPGSKRERLRLAAQVQLFQAVLATEEGRAKLRTFLTSDLVDNAFARVLQHALASHKSTITRLETEDITAVLEVTSHRSTFQMKLADGTVIDFSADKAEASKGRTAWVFSYEFGVGHPALTGASTAVGVAGDSKPGGRTEGLAGQFEARTPPLVRPYHVPADLTNAEVFARVDYKNFMTLRDRLITEVFGLEIEKLVPGGNKAHTLATALDMFQ